MLKQLRLTKDIQLKRTKLADYLTIETDLNKRSDDLVKTLEEATTEEDMKLVDEEIEKLDKEKADNDKAKSTLEEEIEKLEAELNEVEERSKSTNTNQKRSNHKEEKEDMNKLQVRELLKTGEYYKRSEVKDFYEKFKNLRAIGNGELLIPDVVVNRILDIVGDYSTLYPLVEKLRIKGQARIIVDNDTAPAEWMEMPSPLPVGDVGGFAYIDFDGFKVGKVTFVDNYLLQDSIINLDDYVVKKIARAISLAIDLAILKGTGAAGKQPTGIIPSLPTKNKVTVTDAKGFAPIVAPIGLIDTGEDSTGEIVAVMKRSTYYNHLLAYTVLPTASGNTVATLPNLRQPDLLGLRVVFNNNMEDGQILFGDYSKYTLIERETVSIDSSTHAKFREDQTGFRGKGRFDGKPVKPEAFVLVTLETTPVA